MATVCLPIPLFPPDKSRYQFEHGHNEQLSQVITGDNNDLVLQVWNVVFGESHASVLLVWMSKYVRSAKWWYLFNMDRKQVRLVCSMATGSITRCDALPPLTHQVADGGRQTMHNTWFCKA